MDLEGKTAVITGGGTGVGRATALRLARAGCGVLVNYNRSREAAEEVAQLAAKEGVPAKAFQADVANDDACRAMAAEAKTLFGRLDVLVNNAGTTRFIPHDDLEAVTDADWDSILGVNLRGAFQCTRAARALLSADGGGEVVMTSSVAGLAGTGTSIPYCASKAGLNNLTVTLARVLGPHVRVNAVAPGFLDGSWLRDALGEQYETVKGVMASRAPLGKVSTPDDVGEAIVSIIAGSDLITGHVLPVEAGILIGAS